MPKAVSSARPLAAAGVPAIQPLANEALPHLLLSPKDLPADALLMEFEASPASAHAEWRGPPGGKTGRAGWTIRTWVLIAESPEQAVSAAVQYIGSFAVRSPEVSHQAKYAGLGERVWGGTGPTGGSILFVRRNVLGQVFGYGPEDPLELARLLSRKIDAFLSGHPERAVAMPMAAHDWSLADALKLKYTWGLWGEKTTSLVIRIGDQLPRALPARRMQDGEFLVPLRALVRALGVKMDARVNRGNPKHWRIRLGGKKLLVTVGEPQIQEGGRKVKLTHPVQTVSDAMVVPLSITQRVFGWSIKRERWQGRDAVRLFPPPGWVQATRAGTPVKPGPFPAPTLEQANSSDPNLAVANRLYEFNGWPGKHGKVRPGVSIARALAELEPDLRLSYISEPLREPDAAPVGSVRIRWSGRASDIYVTVCRSCEEAQQACLSRLAHDGRGTVALRGSELDVKVGDVSFLYGEPDLSGEARFVRSNIYVEIYAPAGEAIDMAEAIDRALLARPAAASLEELDKFRPQILSLGLAGDPQQPVEISFEQQHRQGRAWTCPLRFKVLDPERGRLDYYWASADGESGVVKQRTGKADYAVYIWARWHRYGVEEHRFKLTAVNECGMFSEATLSVRANAAKTEQGQDQGG